jgi:hypothetical protein
MPVKPQFARSRRLSIEGLERRELLAAAPEVLLHYAGDVARVPGQPFVASGAQWPQPGGTGTALTITYSVANLADGGLPGGLDEGQLHAAIEEALGLWAGFAPLNFVEVTDSGPPPDDIDYPTATHPQIRFGHHFIDGDFAPDVLAHAYFPPHPEFTDGLNGDVHFDNGNTWTLDPDTGVDILEVLVHELGHSLGLDHEEVVTAIMNPFYGGRYDGLETAFLFADDIAGIRAIYGTGMGSVTPLVEMAVLGSGTEIADGDFAASTADGTDFSRTELGGFVERTFTISNQGRGTLQLVGSPRVAITGPQASDFTVVSPPAATIGPLASASFTIRFAPTATGTRGATVTIANSDRDENPYTFTIAGRGRSPVQEIDLVGGAGGAIMSGDSTPTSIDGTDFGFSNVVGGAVTRSFTIINDGALALTLTGQPLVAIGGANASDFVVVTPPQTPVLPDGSTAVAVRFDPSAVGVRTATISISSDDVDEGVYSFTVQGTGYSTSAEIGLFGNGTAIADGDSTASILDHTAFGSVNVAGGVVNRTFTITNTGTGPLHLTGEPVVAISGPAAGDYRVIEAPSTPIPLGGNVTFRVEFDPTAAGTRTATIAIANTDSNENPYDFVISGNAFALAPEITVTGSGVSIASGDMTPDAADGTDFGPVDVGHSPVERTFMVSNSGNSTLHLLGNPLVALLGPNAEDFEIVPPNTGTGDISIGGSTTFVVRFTARGSGVRSATIVIPSDDADEDPFTFAVSGTAIAPPEPPRVAAVRVDSTTGVHAGGAIEVGSGQLQLRALPWVNLDQVVIVFDRPVVAGAGDLTVRGVNTAEYELSAQGFSYDENSNTARWKLAGSIAADKLMIELASFDGSIGVRGVDGTPLDGEWLNPTSSDSKPADTFPSGDGTTGGDFSFRFNILPGDVVVAENGMPGVGVDDFRAVLDRQFLSALDAAYLATADLDGDGAINILDLAQVRDRRGNTLPLGEPLPGESIPSPSAPRSERRAGRLSLQTTRRCVFSFADVAGPHYDIPSIPCLILRAGRRWIRRTDVLR